MRRSFYFAAVLLLLAPVLAAFVGGSIGGGILHPYRLPLNSDRMKWAEKMLEDTHATKEDFVVRASDGIELRGWKVRPRAPNGDWVLLYHGIADNRTGCSGHGEFLLRHGYSLVMMDSRAQGESSGDMATFGWKERNDSVAITDAPYAGEKVRHLYALGVSMGAAIALQSAAVEPRIQAVVAEDPFADLREVSYDYAGLSLGSWLGKSLFRPAVNSAMSSVQKEGGFNPEDVSPEKAVAARPFPVLLICGTRDRRIPCRHAERIYNAVTGPKELWVVKSAEHASALGRAPAEYERRTIALFEKFPENH
jgi:alpha-beta hydrolase superfamily lysophospholipase